MKLETLWAMFNSAQKLTVVEFSEDGTEYKTLFTNSTFERVNSETVNRYAKRYVMRVETHYAYEGIVIVLF